MPSTKILFDEFGEFEFGNQEDSDVFGVDILLVKKCYQCIDVKC